MTAQQRFRLSVILFLLLTGCLVLSTPSLAQTLDLAFQEVDYSQIFMALGASQGLNVEVDPAVTGQGTFQLKGVTFEEALELVAQVSGCTYRISGNTLLVSSGQSTAELNRTDVRYVPVENLTREEIFEALNLVMPPSSIYVPPQGGLVVLQGTSTVLDQAEELLFTLDASKTGTGEQKAKSLLEIFADLSAALQLDLVADPALEDIKLHVQLRSQEPYALIKQIQLLVPLKVEITETTLVVGSLAASSLERVKVYRLNYAEPEAARQALTALINEEQIRIDQDRKSIIVRGTELELAEIDLFLSEFDQPLPQVVLEVWVQEMTSNALKDLGIEWRGVPSVSGGDAPVFLELEWTPWDLILALRVLEEKGEAKLLANPKISTLSGQPARIFVGDRVPGVLKNDDGSSFVSFLESGINLRVTPRISDDEYVTILVQPEVSTFVWRTETDYPQIRTREAETTVRVKDGQPFVLGGLLQDEEHELVSGIPFLSQLPVLGKLFQWRDTKQSQTEMTIIVIPRIIDEGQDVVDQSFFTAAQ